MTDPATCPEWEITTPAGIEALREKYRMLRECGSLLTRLGEDEPARAKFRQAGDLLARQFAVELDCLICRLPTPCQVHVDRPGLPQAVICGRCSARTTGGGGWREERPGPAGLVVNDCPGCDDSSPDGHTRNCRGAGAMQVIA